MLTLLLEIEFLETQELVAAGLLEALTYIINVYKDVSYSLRDKIAKFTRAPTLLTGKNTHACTHREQRQENSAMLPVLGFVAPLLTNEGFF